MAETGPCIGHHLRRTCVHNMVAVVPALKGEDNRQSSDHRRLDTVTRLTRSIRPDPDDFRFHGTNHTLKIFLKNLNALKQGVHVAKNTLLVQTSAH